MTWSGPLVLIDVGLECGFGTRYSDQHGKLGVNDLLT